MTPVTMYLNMDPMGKARPRLGSGRAFMPKAYVKWKHLAGIRMRAAWAGKPMIREPFAMFVVIVRKTGKMRSDLDNVVGSILDTAQDHLIIANDRLYMFGSEIVLAAKETRLSPGIHIMFAQPDAEARAKAVEHFETLFEKHITPEL